IILDRGNSGTVFRYDSGWVPIEDGACVRYAKIETGVVSRYRNIRNIRVQPKPVVRYSSSGRTWEWQEVLYDADLHLLPDPQGHPEGQVVPIRDHIGYNQGKPTEGAPPKDDDCIALTGAIGDGIGGSLDARVRLGGRLSMQLSHLTVA